MSTPFPIFAFSLGREYKLSVAEIASVCPGCRFVSVDPKLAVVSGIDRKTAVSTFKKLGGSVRAFEVSSYVSAADFVKASAAYLKSKISDSEGKHSFALAAVGADLELFDAGLKVKKALRADGLSVRLSNTENRTINAASFKKDRLSETFLECAYLEFGGRGHFAVTIACQDVDAFATRDLEKGRDMEVGMLPPKLARTMVNLAAPGNGRKAVSAVYDPFCGLGTVLIEAADLGFLEVFGSDIEPKMAESTKKALSDYAHKSGKMFTPSVKALDARHIGKEKASLTHAAIVTEGYLGEILTQKTATPEKIEEQKRHLIGIYRQFFSELKRVDFRNPIVMCVPFWDIGGTFTFFEEFFDIPRAAGYYSQKLLPEDINLFPTKFGSLLYRRTGQTVGREVVRIVPGRDFDEIGVPDFHKKHAPRHFEPRGFDEEPSGDAFLVRREGRHEGGKHPAYRHPPRKGGSGFGSANRWEPRKPHGSGGGPRSGGTSSRGGRPGGSNRGK